MRHVLFLALCAPLLGIGCRDKTSPEPPPVALPATSGTQAPRCPPAPDWAAPPTDQAELVAELIYQLGDGPASKDGSRKGTGMRIYANGTSMAYDEVEVGMRGGKVQTTPIPGRWRHRGPVSEKRLEELRTVVAQLDLSEISEWQGRERTGAKRPTFVTVRRDGRLVRSCYRVDGTAAQLKLEATIKTIIGDAVDAMTKSSAPYASSSGAPPAGAPPKH